MNVGYVRQLGYVGPMAAQHRLAFLVPLDLGDGDHPGAFQSDVEPADTGEQGHDS